MSDLAKSRAGNRGTALVEFALVLPFLLVLTVCVIDVSRAFWIKNVTTQAAREAVRYAVVHTLADTSGVRSRAQTVVESASVTLSQCTLEDLGSSQWRATVGTQFNWIYLGMFNWLGAGFTNPVTLTAKAVMRKEG